MLLLSLLILNFFIQQPGKVPVVKFNELEKIMNAESDTSYVINFWATWCKPCVQELPSFDSAFYELKDEKIKIVLVSLDFKNQYETRLQPFIEKNKIQHRVLLLDEPDYDSWINKIDSSWSGSIPATLIVNKKNGFRAFFEMEFSKNSLVKEIRKSLNTKP